MPRVLPIPTTHERQIRYQTNPALVTRPSKGACIYLCVSIIVEADIGDPLHEEQMYNGALRGDIKIKINQIQS